MRRYTLSELMGYDNELYMLAHYEASEGMIPVFRTQEDMLEFRMSVARIFNRYKISIRAGEYDVDFIVRSVMSSYGAIPHPDMTQEEIIEKVIDGSDEDIVSGNPLRSAMENVMSNIKNHLPPIQPEDFEDDIDDMDDEDWDDLPF